ncbi:MAG: hypothetical protein QJR08_04340 [Bacillota bacterium]|nr:hypothetical protein [Bacillota bacterium]
MTRDELREIARRHAPDVEAAVREVAAWYASEAGRREIAEGPMWWRGKSAEEIAEALRSEIAALMG